MLDLFYLLLHAGQGECPDRRVLLWRELNSPPRTCLRRLRSTGAIAPGAASAALCTDEPGHVSTPVRANRVTPLRLTHEQIA